MTTYEYEVLYRRDIGCLEYATIEDLENALKAIGYSLDRTMDCACTAQYITGNRIGRHYPSLTCGIYETDTGLSAFHYQARRDENFQKLQDMRQHGVFVALQKSHQVFEL